MLHTQLFRPHFSLYCGATTFEPLITALSAPTPVQFAVTEIPLGVAFTLVYSTPVWRAAYMVTFLVVSVEQLATTAVGMLGVICVSQIWKSGSSGYSVPGIAAALYVGMAQAVTSAWTAQIFADQSVARSAMCSLFSASFLSGLFALLTFGLSVATDLEFPDARLSGTSTILLLITGCCLSAGWCLSHSLGQL